MCEYMCIYESMCVSICVWVCTYECRCSQRPEIKDAPRAGGTGGYSLPDIGVRSRTQVL